MSFSQSANLKHQVCVGLRVRVAVFRMSSSLTGSAIRLSAIPVTATYSVALLNKNKDGRIRIWNQYQWFRKIMSLLWY